MMIDIKKYCGNHELEECLSEYDSYVIEFYNKLRFSNDQLVFDYDSEKEPNIEEIAEMISTAARLLIEKNKRFS